MGHRYYDPGTGRFLTRDPLGYGGGMNLYGYADGNPVNESDPSGFDPDRDDPTSLPGDNDGHWGMTTSASGTHEGFKRGTSQNNARRSMTKGLGSIFWDTALGMLNPEGKAAEVLAEGIQAFRAVRPLSSPHYSVAFEANLQRGVHYPGRSAFSHFAEANRQLHTFMQSNLEYAQQLEHMFPGIGRAVSPGRRGAYSRLAPPGTSWHHHPTRGVYYNSCLGLNMVSLAYFRVYCIRGQRRNGELGRRKVMDGIIHSPDATKPLKSIIESIDLFPWDYVLYVSHPNPWNEDTLCLVLDPADNDSDDPDEEPLIAKQLGLKAALGVSETQEIVANATSQVPNVNVADLIKAFNYYYANDAFMEF